MEIQEIVDGLAALCEKRDSGRYLQSEDYAEALQLTSELAKAVQTLQAQPAKPDKAATGPRAGKSDD